MMKLSYFNDCVPQTVGLFNLARSAYRIKRDTLTLERAILLEQLEQQQELSDE